jgi:hypothetical protein
MPPDFHHICRTVHAALVSLHASGADGFEGLIRDAYREVTGVALRLQKPGPQGGADAVSDGADEIAAGIEAKRYRETTSLPLHELKNKLIDAATRLGNPIELWILAASKEISGDDVAQLRRIGEHNGLGVLVLDWRSGADPVAPLPLLLALAPAAARRCLGEEAARALDAITRHPEFDVRKRALLDELTRPDLGRSHAATAVADRMAQTLRSRADAKARLQNPVDMEAPSRIWAPRDGHCQVIQEWSQDAATTPICAIIGEEGAGKTWLMFDWWRRAIGREARPLILWLSAREVTSSSLSEVMGAALAKWITIPRRDAAFWSRRIELWRRTRDGSGATPSMWLMLDGVNEGSAQQHVATVLAEALATEWKGVVGILLSDRPAHWERRFQSGKGLELRPKTVSVTRFTDAELDGMLARHGKSRDVFSANVLELIKWPSWFAVAAEMFARERDWSAHSAEHLMMRYVQHRLEERTQVSAISNEMFREFMTGLGAEMQANWGPGRKFSRAELKERLSGYSGEPDKGILDAVDDITSGIWMTPDGLNRFSIDKGVLPFAISLALLNQLRSASTEEEADSEIERFLGPIEDQDVGVNVLAAAASLAFIDEGLADHTRKALLKRWLPAHNFDAAHFQLLWRIGSASPHALFAVAEDLWMQRASGSSVDELLIKSIANVATEGGGQTEVIGFLAKWAAAYWPDPKEGEFLNYHPDAQASATARAETEQRLAQMRANIGGDDAALASLHACENGAGPSWLVYRVLSIATYLPRAAQTPVWRGWALSRAVMDRARHFDDLAWSLRVNPLDGPAATQALLETVDGLLALPSSQVRRMAVMLLEIHGGPEAAARLHRLGETFGTRRWNRREEQARVVDGIVLVTDDRERSDRNLVSLLSDFADDPALRISDAERDQLERYAAAFPVEKLGDGRGQTGAGIDLNQAKPALAHWAPEALAELYRRYLSTLRSRDEQRLLGQMFSLDSLLVLLTDAHQEDIRATLIARFAAKDAGTFDQIEHALWHAAVFDRSPAEQRQLWADIGAPDVVPTSLEHLIRQVPDSVLRGLEDELHPSRAPKRLVSWLAYLKCSSPVRFPEDWEPLWKLFDHEDGNVRYLAFELALASRDKRLARRLHESDWAVAAGRGVLENWAGSMLLCEAATDENFTSVSKRIDPQWSGVLWEHFGYDPAYSSPFEAFLASSAEHELNPLPSRQFPEYRCNPEQATRKLLEQKATLLTGLAERLFAAEGAMSAFVRDEWPRLQLLQAWFAHDPAHAAGFWRTLVTRSNPFRGTSEELDELPFEASDGEEVNALRVFLLERARDDWALAGIGMFIARHQRAEWAVGRLRQMLAEPACPGDIARAITLAGLLDDSPAAREVWAQDLATAPLDGWLGVVYRDARQNIERAWRALDWIDRMFEADTDERFFACWQLFIRLADRRLHPIASRRVAAKLDSLNPRRRDFISLNWREVGEHIKKAKNDREATLFSYRIGHRLALPWGDG